MDLKVCYYVKIFTILTETNILGIDEISPEIEPINVKGGAYVN